MSRNRESFTSKQAIAQTAVHQDISANIMLSLVRDWGWIMNYVCLGISKKNYHGNIFWTSFFESPCSKLQGMHSLCIFKGHVTCKPVL